MSPLNIYPEEVMAAPKKRKSKTLKVMLGIGVLILVPVIGSTFAASIAINSSAPVQFAQGSIATAGCDSDLTVKATSAYLSGAFKLGTITISDIDLTTGCEGKTLVVSVDVNTAEADIITNVKQISFTIPSTVTAGGTVLTNITSDFTAVLSNAAGNPYSSSVAYNDAAKIVIGFSTPANSLIDSADVDKFLVQSS